MQLAEGGNYAAIRAIAASEDDRVPRFERLD